MAGKDRAAPAVSWHCHLLLQQIIQSPDIVGRVSGEGGVADVVVLLRCGRARPVPPRRRSSLPAPRPPPCPWSAQYALPEDAGSRQWLPALGVGRVVAAVVGQAGSVPPTAPPPHTHIRPVRAQPWPALRHGGLQAARSVQREVCSALLAPARGGGRGLLAGGGGGQQDPVLLVTLQK